MPRVDWNDLKIAKLKKMALAGRTSYEIADAIGETRGAVCGKCMRLGISLKGKPFGPINCAKLKGRKKKLSSLIFSKKVA